MPGHDGDRAESHHPQPQGLSCRKPLWWFIKIVSILLVIVAPAFFTSCVQKHIFSDMHVEERCGLLRQPGT